MTNAFYVFLLTGNASIRNNELGKLRRKRFRCRTDRLRDFRRL